MKLKPIFTLAIAPLCAVALLACNPNKGPSDGKVEVTFKDYDGTVLQTKRIEKGLDTSYKQEKLPSKPLGENEEANIFVGWDNKMTNIRKDTVFTPVFKTIEKGKYVDKDHDGMPEGVDPNDDPENNGNYFEVGAKSMVYLDQNITIDFSKFLVENANMKYDNEIAKLGLFMSNPKIDFKDGKFSDKAYGGRENALYSRLGFDDFHHFDFKDDAAKNYTYDPNDTTSGVYGHKYLYNDDGQIVKDLIVIAFEGTNGKRRWSSNFDVGVDNSEYYDKTGGEASHPEWDNKNYHKGFYVAARRVLADKVDGDTKEGPVKFLDYISKHSSHSNGKPIIFVTGHSRGGAMANLVGCYLNKYMNDTCIPFTYAFAAPSVWGSEKSAPGYGTIFHVLNEDDIVTKVPHSEWGFSKIGVTKSISVETDNGGALKKAYEENSKKTYGYIANPESIFHNLKCGSRTELYSIDKLGGAPKYLSDQIGDNFSNEDEANERVKEMTKFNKNNFGQFANFVDLIVKEHEDEDGKTYYGIHANCCVATITSLVQNIMTENKGIMENPTVWAPYLNNSYFKEFMKSLTFEILYNTIVLGLKIGDAVALPHDYGAYHIILREYKETTNK